VHCLARESATAPPEPDPPAEILDEGAFRAARYGTAADLPDAEGRLCPVATLLDDALALAAPHAAELGCADELDGVRGLLEHQGGAGRQRAAHAIGGMGGLLRDTAGRTAAAA
jgi:glutamate---cysteine ligase / carboxylate-amine ligase